MGTRPIAGQPRALLSGLPLLGPEVDAMRTTPWLSANAPARALTLGLGLAGLTLGCGEDIESPLAPAGVPALATTAAVALVFRFVSAGDGHTCGVTTDDRAFCWGNNHLGQLGDGTQLPHSFPTAVLGGLRFRNVSVGTYHSCGVTTANRAYCWGYGGFGQVGDGTTNSVSHPVAVAGGRSFSQVRSGAYHTCGVTPLGVAYCWGRNDIGQLGNFSHAAG